MKKICILTLLISIPILTEARFQETSDPEITTEGLSIEAILELPDNTVRTEFNKSDSTLYFITQEGGIYSVNTRRGTYQRRQSSSDHGLGDVQGFEISPEGTVYIVGNNRNGGNATNVAVIKRATIEDGNWTWETIAQTEPYPLSNTAFDHIVNGIVLSPDGSTLYINSGSRTDHGEIHDVDGLYPNLREAPLTAKILQVPADANDILLKNNLDTLKANGYVYAEGTRNSFSLAFDADGNLFGTENAGDRDDPEELNWLREGRHYGFPWVIGGNETPMQFEGYDPDNDPFIPENSTAANLGTFYNDPDYPAPPEGVEFTPGVTNVGPDADTFRDPADGLIKDASDLGLTVSTFSSHLSPLGLVFDTEEQLGGEFTGDGFMLGFSGGAEGDAFLLSRMDYHGEDLIHLEFTPTEDNFEVSVTSLVRGFLNPIDAEIVGNTIYIIEHGNSSWLNADKTTQMYAVTFPSATSNEPDTETPVAFSLEQNYPNPFNPTTNISFELSNPGYVEISVTDVLGREVETLVNRQMNASGHTVTFNATGLSSGIYFYTLNVDGAFIQTRKMLLIK